MKITQQPTKDVPLSYDDIDYHETAYCEYCGAEATVSKKDLTYDADDLIRLPKCPKCKHQLTTARGSTVPTMTQDNLKLVFRHKASHGCVRLALLAAFLVILFCVTLTIIF